jgi:hypothetical protein
LATFIDGYARFAKLPRPRLAAVSWRSLLDSLRESQAIRIVEPLPQTPAWLDATLAAREQGGGVVLEVQDRRSGLGQAVLRDALLPSFFFPRSPRARASA